VWIVPHGLGNIYGENKYPVNQLKLGKKGRRVKSQEHTHRDKNMAAEDEWLVPGPSHTHQDKVLLFLILSLLATTQIQPLEIMRIVRGPLTHDSGARCLPT